MTPANPTPEKDGEDYEAVMKRCQRGTRNYDEANSLHADCYGTIGKLRNELASTKRRLAEVEKERERDAAKLSERKTVHEWLNALNIPREEDGKQLCLLRRLRITCDLFQELRDQPSADDVILIRCTKHLNVGQQNKNEHSGGECGGCIAADLTALRNAADGQFSGINQCAKRLEELIMRDGGKAWHDAKAILSGELQFFRKELLKATEAYSALIAEGAGKSTT